MMRVNFHDLMFGFAAVVAVYGRLWPLLGVVALMWVVMPTLERWVSSLVRARDFVGFFVGLMLLSSVGIFLVGLAVVVGIVTI